MARDGRGRWIAVVVLSVVVGGIVVWAVLAVADRARADADVLRVYCLAPGRRADLVNAATALDLARPGNSADRISAGGAEMSVAEWRKRRGDDFEQACQALSAAQQPAASGVFTTLLPFLTALFGAVAAFAATAWRDRSVRGQAIADDLQRATEPFLRTAGEFLAQERAGVPDTEVAAARVALVTQVRRVRAAHPGWALARAVEDVLTTGPLGPSFGAGWSGNVDAEAGNEVRRAELGDVLDGTGKDLADLAARVARPLRAGARS